VPWGVEGWAVAEVRRRGKPLTSRQLFDAACAAYFNAERLLDDADILIKAGRAPTAFSLCVLASEEMGKFIITAAAATHIAVRPEYVETFHKRFRSHGRKLSTLLLFDVPAERLGDHDFVARHNEVVASGNIDKQRGLYVDIDEGGNPVSPKDVVDLDEARRLHATVREQLLRHAETVWASICLHPARKRCAPSVRRC